jgi:hypothetical protein
MIEMPTATERFWGSFGRGGVHRNIKLQFLGGEGFPHLFESSCIEELAGSLEPETPVCEVRCWACAGQGLSYRVRESCQNV